MTRILHVITRSEWGGAQRIVELLATRSEFESIVACAPGGRLVTTLRDQGVTVHEVESLVRSPHPVKDLGAAIELVRLIRQGKYDLIHCHSTKAGVLGRVVGAGLGIPTVFTVHGWGFYNSEYASLSPVIETAERGLSRITDEIVCVSENDCDVGRQKGILNSGSGTVIHNGIPPLSVDEDPALQAAITSSADSLVLGSVGRLAEQKNPEAVIRLGWALRDKGYNVETVLVGDGPQREHCQRLAAKREETTHVLGFKNNALELLGQFDILTLPSRFEGFPLTVLEAMHLGVPVLAYDVGGVAEAVADGTTGSVVPAGDFDELTAAGERMLDDPSLRVQMSEAATERAREMFTASRMVSEYDQVYRSQLS